MNRKIEEVIINNMIIIKEEVAITRNKINKDKNNTK